MLAGGAFREAKADLKRYVGSLSAGDHVLILAFDDEISIVVDSTITGAGGTRAIKRRIDSLKASGPWTYMTMALARAATQVERMQAAAPQMKQSIYLLTDGKNDPPPGLEGSPLSFADILRQHFDTFTAIETNFYVCGLRGRVDPGLQTFIDKTDASVGSGPSLPAEVDLQLANPDLGEIDLAGGEQTVTRRLTIKMLFLSLIHI